jgi:hypothetical protein
MVLNVEEIPYLHGCTVEAASVGCHGSALRHVWTGFGGSGDGRRRAQRAVGVKSELPEREMTG